MQYRPNIRMNLGDKATFDRKTPKIKRIGRLRYKEIQAFGWNGDFEQ